MIMCYKINDISPQSITTGIFKDSVRLCGEFSSS